MKVREGKDKDFRLNLLIPVLSGVLKCWSASVRMKVYGNEIIEKYLVKQSRPSIISFWHFGLIQLCYYFRSLPPTVVMISGSKDGEIAARIAKRWGHIPVRSSKMKGGLNALKEMKKLMHKGHNAAIVVDGSRGPARIAQKGVVVLSRETNAPILPIGIAAKPVLRFNSWDRMILPLPGSKCVLVCKEPLFVPKNVRGKELESFRLKIENRLNDACMLAEDFLDKKRT